MSETKEVGKSQEKATERSHEEALIDFRSAVEAEENGENENGNTGNNVKMLDPVADRHVLRCSKCGHFLADVITKRLFIKMLCRQAECKALNEVTVDGNSIHYNVKPRDARNRGTMRV